nr:putative 33 kDa early protein [Ectropis obliqua nucleopolyhedrovirus]
MRTIQSSHLSKILATELTYLYNIACIITYREVQENEIELIKEWVVNLNKEFNLEQMKIEFHDKMSQLNLTAFEPTNYSYTFRTIWNVIHFLGIIIDDIVENRNKLTYDFIVMHLRQMKAIYYNLFFKLDCAMCRDHYLNVKGYIIFAIERIEICLNRERGGETIEMVDEIDVHNETRNVLMRHGVLYATMVFHNHINDYRWIQRNVKPPVNSMRMQWQNYKKMLNI